ncbi:MAG: hypothetical protein HC897_12735 [Thermoanaerobaculia bacterium]|nr:hypothetical protein [Thermoanaerobaculia bacterium]
MHHRELELTIAAQPNETTCGPTSLHAVYRYWGDDLPLERVIDEVQGLETGGTLGVLLACHALRRGYRAALYTYNLNVFDPTWFQLSRADLRNRLLRQLEHKTDAKLRLASEAFLDFLDLGGELRLVDLSPRLIRRLLDREIPILTGLSATFLYRSPREIGPRCDYDDIRGEPAGHFVVLCGYDPRSHKVTVADPLHPNPMSPGQLYSVPIERLTTAILLGVLTYDANLLVLEPKPGAKIETVNNHRTTLSSTHL